MKRGVNIVSILTDLSTSFILGLLTPLTAICVLPLYPGFLVYLSSQLSGKETNRRLPVLFGLIITSGVIFFMFLLGLVFTTFLEISLTKVIGIVSPIAFVILFVIGILLIFDVDAGRFFPRANIPRAGNPFLSAFIYGFFFGAIVVPCNPLFIAALFTKTVLSSNFISNILNFLFFGLGIGFPLLAFSVVSMEKSRSVINYLVKYKRNINLFTGIILMVISAYYLIIVFKIFG